MIRRRWIWGSNNTINVSFVRVSANQPPFFLIPNLTNMIFHFHPTTNPQNFRMSCFRCWVFLLWLGLGHVRQRPILRSHYSCHDDTRRKHSSSKFLVPPIANTGISIKETSNFCFSDMIASYERNDTFDNFGKRQWTYLCCCFMGHVATILLAKKGHAFFVWIRRSRSRRIQKWLCVPKFFWISYQWY